MLRLFGLFLLLATASSLDFTAVDHFEYTVLYSPHECGPNVDNWITAQTHVTITEIGGPKFNRPVTLRDTKRRQLRAAAVSPRELVDCSAPCGCSDDGCRMMSWHCADTCFPDCTCERRLEDEDEASEIVNTARRAGTGEECANWNPETLNRSEMSSILSCELTNILKEENTRIPCLGDTIEARVTVL
jgi:hypothetical protein